jgi:hypothetical protein
MLLGGKVAVASGIGKGIAGVSPLPGLGAFVLCHRAAIRVGGGLPLPPG